MRARGGFEVDIVWRKGLLKNVTVRAPSNDGKVKLRYGAWVTEVELKQGQSRTVSASLFK